MSAALPRPVLKSSMTTELHLQDADGFYEQLLDAHLGLSTEQSQLLNARLILLLASNEQFIDAFWAGVLGGIVPVPVAIGISDEHRHKLLRIARKLDELARTVRRDIHKMRAFVRFREVTDAEGPRFVAWFEPEHHIVRANARFFVDRFAAMLRSIEIDLLAKVYLADDALSAKAGASFFADGGLQMGVAEAVATHVQSPDSHSATKKLVSENLTTPTLRAWECGLSKR